MFRHILIIFKELLKISEAYIKHRWIIKVKCCRYRPGVAKRVGRGIALLFHDRGTRRGWVVSSTPRPHFTPGKDRVPILQEAGWALGTVWTGGKYRPHRDSIPDRPACSQSLYRLSYRAHDVLLSALKFVLQMFVDIVKFVCSRAELVHNMWRLQIYRFLQWIISRVNILCTNFNVLNNASVFIIHTNKCTTHTHAHIYIYIYIYISFKNFFCLFVPPRKNVIFFVHK